ncbi:hypothetical protein F511_11184 [Dorcoceras hygrometricum]|uniref:Uncharacterized protein n=1 Tax=Dorcoceras hygrometricum TaxID=472368 RepID=A0A2Z7B1Y0_9LAMI|nr:hypothetical protein F511_11184 [Dorcoceras hygrometricum]
MKGAIACKSGRILVSFVALFSLLLIITSTTQSSDSHKAVQLQARRRHHSCDPVAAGQQIPTVCFQLQKLLICHCPPFPPPPPLHGDGREIDPRYGVEKRLVPSGPNPLHN